MNLNWNGYAVAEPEDLNSCKENYNKVNIERWLQHWQYQIKQPMLTNDKTEEAQVSE